MSSEHRAWEVGGGYEHVKLKRKAGSRWIQSWFGELGI